MAAAHQSDAFVLDLFERYYERVYRFTRRSVPADLAEDIAQDVFVRLLSIKDLEKKTISASYLIKIADNLIKRRYHQRLRREATEQIKRQQTVAATVTTGGLRRLEEEERRAQLSHASRELTANECDVLRMIVADGASYQAAAEALGVRVSSINNWKYRGLQRLKQRQQIAGRHEYEASTPSERRRSAPRTEEPHPGVAAPAEDARRRDDGERSRPGGPDTGRDRFGQRAG